MPRRFLILHGLGGSGPGHWQPWLAGRLRSAGADVVFPDLPEPDAPSLDRWLAALAAVRAPDGGEIVVCHSLGSILWLHHRAGGADVAPPAERALLVSPPSATAGLPEIAGFFPVPVTGVPEGRLVASDDDPYCPEGAEALYDGPLELVRGGGHLNVDAGLGPWPAVEAWAREGDATGLARA